jgi:hypothetical protein
LDETGGFEALSVIFLERAVRRVRIRFEERIRRRIYSDRRRADVVTSLRLLHQAKCRIVELL